MQLWPKTAINITLVLGVILFHLYLYNITVSWAITLRFPTLMFVDQGVSSLSSAAQLCTADQGGLWWPYCGYGPACVRGTKKTVVDSWIIWG